MFVEDSDEAENLGYKIGMERQNNREKQQCFRWKCAALSLAYRLGAIVVAVLGISLIASGLCEILQTGKPLIVNGKETSHIETVAFIGLQIFVSAFVVFLLHRAAGRTKT